MFGLGERAEVALGFGDMSGCLSVSVEGEGKISQIAGLRPANDDCTMRIGIYSYFGYPLRLEDRLDLIAAKGFRITGLGLGMEEDLVRAGRADVMADLARDRGLEVEYVHAAEGMCNDLWSREVSKRRAAAQVYADGVSYCARHGVKTLVVHVIRSKGAQPDAPHRHGLEVLGDLVKYAEDSGVGIAAENTQKEDFIDYVLGNLESAALGLCYDSSHDFLYDEEPGRLLKRWGERLMTTHVSDNDGLEDRHWLPGEGRIRWDRVKVNFPAETYEGCLMLEVFPKDARVENPAHFLDRAYWFIEKLGRFLSQEVGG